MIFSSVLLPEPLRPMMPSGLSAWNLERRILHRFEIVKAGVVAEHSGEQFAHRVRTLVDDAEALGDVL